MEEFLVFGLHSRHRPEIEVEDRDGESFCGSFWLACQTDLETQQVSYGSHPLGLSTFQA